MFEWRDFMYSVRLLSRKKHILSDLVREFRIYMCNFKTGKTSFDGSLKWLEKDMDGNWLTRVHVDDRHRVLDSWQNLVSGEEDLFRDYYRFGSAEEGWHWIHDRCKIIARKSNSSALLALGIVEDITNIKKIQEEATRCAGQASTLNSIFEVIASSLDLDETVDRILEQAKRFIPYDRATVQFIEGQILRVIGGVSQSEDGDIVKGYTFPYPDENSPSTKAILEKKPVLVEDLNEKQVAMVDLQVGSHTASWLGIPLVAHRDVIGIISFCSDNPACYTRGHLELARSLMGPVAIVLENSRMHGEAYRMAMEDALTGIGSRHAFDLNGRYLFNKAQRDKTPISLAMMDLDNFKQINDKFGHSLGDIVLREVARTSLQKLRSTDFIARYGGEEIIILFSETEIESGVNVVERIRRSVSELTFEGMDRNITVSVGITGCIPGKDTSLGKMIEDADSALYSAKACGKNQTVMR